MDFFRAFARYSLLYEEAFVYLKKKISKSSGFRAFIENVESRPELQRSNVTNYMIIPVSRIARYNLLLRVPFFILIGKHPMKLKEITGNEKILPNQSPGVN